MDDRRPTWGVMQEVTRRVASGARMSLLGRIFGRAMALFTHLVLAHLLPRSEYGVFAVGWATTRILGYVGTAGLDKGAVRFGGQARQREPDFSGRVVFSALILVLASSSIVAAVSYGVATPVAVDLFGKPELARGVAAFVPAIWVAGFFRAVMASSTVDGYVHRAVLGEELFQPTLFLCAVVVVRQLHILDAESVALVYAGSMLLPVGLVLLLMRRARLFVVGWPRERISRLLSFALVSQLGGFLSMLVLWNDRLLVGAFLPLERVGNYQAAAQLAMVFAMLQGAMNTVLGPAIARADDARELEQIYATVTRWMVYVAVPAVVAICVDTAGVLRLTVGAQYVDATAPLVILTLGQAASVLCGSSGFLLVMAGYYSAYLKLSFVMVVGHFAVGTLLIPLYGASGAALDTAIFTALSSVVAVLFARRWLGVKVYDRTFLKPLVAGVASALAAVGCHRLWPGSIYGTLAMIVVSASVFWAILVALGIPASDRRILMR